MNPYKILGVKKEAEIADIKKEYYRLSKEHHPDLGGEEEKFKEVEEAYRILSDEKLRAEYDEFGEVKNFDEKAVVNQLLHGLAESLMQGLITQLPEDIDRFLIVTIEKVTNQNIVQIQQDQKSVRELDALLKRILKSPEDDLLSEMIITNRIKLKQHLVLLNLSRKAIKKLKPYFEEYRFARKDVTEGFRHYITSVITYNTGEVV